MTEVDRSVEPSGHDVAHGLPPEPMHLRPYGISVGPVTHLAAERERLNGLGYDSFEVVAQGTTLGGEVRGLDLATSLAEPVIDDLRRALVDFKVLFFRDQPLTHDQHLGFARRFGELEVHPFFKANDRHAELARLEKGATVGGFENAWHHDVTWRECPSMAAVLRAVEVPRTGGDTLFADMAGAYEGLSDETKERVSGLHAIHDFMGAFGWGLPEDERRAMRERYPPARHPVIRTHPESGRKVIYVNRVFTTHIEGIDADESVGLILELTRQAEVVEYQVRFRWEPHSLVFWDNRCVQHYAASDYWPQARVMERASIIGDAPY